MTFRRPCSRDWRAYSGSPPPPLSLATGSKSRSAGSSRSAVRAADQSSVAFVLVRRVPWGHLHLIHWPQRHRVTEKSEKEFTCNSFLCASAPLWQSLVTEFAG